MKKDKTRPQFAPMGGSQPTGALHILASKRKEYAQQWSSANAAKFESGGHYAWMAHFLAGYATVLEVGTGDGRGTLALLNAGHTVVSVDENPDCLHAAKRRLEETGRSVHLVMRERVQPFGPGYRIDYGLLNATPETGGALLVNGDLINDPALIEWLTRLPAFDALACWLIGTHNARPMNEVVRRVGIRDNVDLRLSVQNQVFRLANDILRPGGVVQVVDRAEPATTEEKHTELVRGYQEQVDLAPSLTMTRVEQRLYEEPDTGTGVRMIPTREGLGDRPAVAFTCVIAEKQT